MYRLRELAREDLTTINSWRSSRDLIDQVGAPYRYINKETEEAWFETYMQNRAGNIRCSILNQAEDLIGLVSLTNIDRINQTAVFHIMLGSAEEREKGAGSFATEEILKHAFLDMNLNRIELTVLEDNKRAIGLYNKYGFKKEGIKRQATYKNGEFQNMVLMSVLKSEFIAEVI